MKNALPNKVTFVRGDFIEEDLGIALLLAENGAVKRGEYMIMHEKDFGSMLGILYKIEKLLSIFKATDA